MSELIIQSGIKIPQKEKSKEYILGSKIFLNLLKVGDSVFVSEIRPKQLFIRLNRLSGESGVFSIFKETSEAGINGYRVFRLKKIESNQEKESIEPQLEDLKELKRN